MMQVSNDIRYYSFRSSEISAPGKAKTKEAKNK